ncbi:unnamed protein product [Paramecium pentaurelia]|uniref:Protein kinase domain-containing protein n=1 Tax=Paramecium pentaurelia TaxID=43138 RepID=A0A8S1UBR0_9CILI|nr:unnamed protein product [Paramecium pentaurelia]
MSESCKRIISNYICNTENLLGQGLICTVYEAKYLETNKYVALKQISKKPKQWEKMTASKLEQSYKLELAILKQCQERFHKNIISLLDNFETQDHFYIVLELCDSNLKEYLEKQQNKRLEEQQAIDILKQIVEGEKCLHELKYCHRDIKPENILLKDGCVKITDVNLAKNIEDMYQAAQHSSVGTPFYLAPEVNSKQIYCPYKADIYSLGVVLYEMVYGLVDKSKEIINFNNKIKDSQLNISQDLKKLIISMLDSDPEKRANWSDVSTFINQYKNCKVRFLNQIIRDFGELQNLIKDKDINICLYPSGLLIIKLINKLIQERQLELQKLNKYEEANQMKQHQEGRVYLQKSKQWYESQIKAKNQVICQSDDLRDEFRYSDRNSKFNKHFQCYLVAFFNQLNNFRFKEEEQNIQIKLLKLKIIIACDLLNDLEKVQTLLSQNLLQQGQNILGFCQNLKDIKEIEEYTKALLPLIDQIPNDL